MEISSVAVVPLENLTTTYEIEQLLTRSLVQELVQKTPLSVVNQSKKADAVVQGVVSRISASPVTFGSASFGSTFLVTLVAKLELRDRRTGEVLFKNDRFVFRDQYVISVEVENFFSELNPALKRISQDFAASAVSTMMEGF
jgi:hypothetical protein